MILIKGDILNIQLILVNCTDYQYNELQLLLRLFSSSPQQRQFRTALPKNPTILAIHSSTHFLSPNDSLAKNYNHINSQWSKPHQKQKANYYLMDQFFLVFPEIALSFNNYHPMIKNHPFLRQFFNSIFGTDAMEILILKKF